MPDQTVPFYNLDTQAQGEISRLTKRLLVKKGETLFGRDELLRYFYIVVSGKIKSYQLNLDNGKEQTIFIFREGDMFDTIVLLDGQPHDVMYEALEDSELLQLPIEEVRHLLHTNESFNRMFFPYLAKQMRHMEELATDLSLYSTSERLIKLLLQNLDPNNRLKYKLIQGLSNTEIAKLIGTVRHVVERHLKALKADGTIATKNKDVQILDANKLLEKINLF
ncbi:cAMP-binding proteins-catabolite gene activator and regulatory subunit of cAMP-dependent protein kinases [hydrothermal vent metagenome]|uniref:cAMP-binding proteins-catabolite gene activator and regulatory subunit of cAMP-dependent protein kinases n=1 Tax=hydrothermal vent metagenome TaxID=652676 RepID=A0A1W1E8I3_9ZZZZ